MSGTANGATPESQTPAGGEGQETTPNPTTQDQGATNDQAQTNQGEQGATPETSETDKELPQEVKALLSKLRKESSDKDKALKNLTDKVKGFEDAQLSEAERNANALKDAQTKVSALTDRVRSAFLAASVTTAAASLNVVDIETVQALLPSVGPVEYDDNDQPTNVADLLGELVKRKPFLVKSAEPPKPAQSGSATNPQSTRNGGDITMEWINKATPNEIAARLPEVQALLAKSGK